jgi:hypothetical protein
VQRWCAHHQPDENGCYRPCADQFVPEDKVMEAIPVLWGDTCGDGVVGVLRGNGLAEGDGDQQASGGAFGIYCWVNGAGINPVLTKGSDVLL